MTAAIERQDLLLSQMLDLASGGNFGERCLCLRSCHTHLIKALTIGGPILVLPLQGRKQVRDAERSISVSPGEIFFVPGLRTLDVENIPDATTGEYLAIGISIHESVLDVARRLLPDRVRTSRGEIASIPLGELQEPLLKWCAALQQGRIPLACHAMAGVVLQLYEMGHHSLLEPPVPTLGGRIRSMVAENPGREWSSLDLEHSLGMSGATIRRHLAAEGASLRKIIVEARLARALELLYTTRLPVKTVAQRVGYASASSFVKRFSERYGTEPSRIGNA